MLIIALMSVSTAGLCCLSLVLLTFNPIPVPIQQLALTVCSACTMFVAAAAPKTSRTFPGPSPISSTLPLPALQLHQKLAAASQARRSGRLDVERQQRALRQAVILAAEITVRGGCLMRRANVSV